jgi:hypothetical protein
VTAFLRPTSGSAAIRIGYGWPQQLSHDGRFALAIRGETLVVMPTGAGDERTIETGLPDLLSARWLPGDERVVFLGRDREGSTVARLTSVTGSEVRNLAAGLKLRTTSYYNRSVTPVSPDGRKIAVGVEGGVALLPLDGAAPRAVPGAEPSDQPIQWSSDGRRLFLFDPRGLPSRLVELELESGRRRVIGQVGPADLEDVAGITSALVTPDLSVRVITFQRVRSDLYRVEGLR